MCQQNEDFVAHVTEFSSTRVRHEGGVQFSDLPNQAVARNSRCCVRVRGRRQSGVAPRTGAPRKRNAENALGVVQCKDPRAGAPLCGIPPVGRGEREGGREAEAC